MIHIKSHPGCLHREAGKQTKSSVVTTPVPASFPSSFKEGKHGGRKGGRKRNTELLYENAVVKSRAACI